MSSTLTGSLRPLLLSALCLCAAPGLLFGTAAHAQTGGEASVDSDLDGVNDAVDAEPCNPNVAARVYVPADRTWGMFLFEDMWPARGDFDFNDAVVGYNQVLRYDAGGQLTGLRLELAVMAVGAGSHNGLALRLPGVPRASVTSLQATVGNAPSSPSTGVRLDEGAAEATIILADHLHGLFGAAEAATRPWINTDPAQPLRPYVDLVVELQLLPGVPLSAADAPFDLFLFNRERGTEVHRPRYGGTTQLDATLFNTGDDGSTASRRFVTTSGIPFALELPELTNWPREEAGIDLLYPGIVAFGASAGAQSADFYRHPAPGHAFGLVPPRTLLAAAAPDTTCFAPDPGVCGAASGTGSVGAPSSGLCSFGTASGVTQSGGMHRWSCSGNYSAPTACTAPEWLCQPNLPGACTVPGGTGTRVCNGSGTGWGSCTVTACNGGYYQSGNSCLAQVCQPGATQACAVTNGTGAQTCDNLGSAWSACAAVSCHTGYTRSGNVCVANPTCTDFIRNGNETGVDCGGTCGKCATGQGCSVNNDCASNVCSGGTCVASGCSNQTTMTAGVAGCVNVSVGRPASASSVYSIHSVPSANDDNQCTYWNSGTYAPGWWQVDLGEIRPLRGVSVSIAQSPPGNTTHVFEVSTNGSTWTTARTLSQYTSGGQVLWLDFGAHYNARWLRVRSISSPSWIAWVEVAAFVCP